MVEIGDEVRVKPVTTRIRIELQGRKRTGPGPFPKYVVEIETGRELSLYDKIMDWLGFEGHRRWTRYGEYEELWRASCAEREARENLRIIDGVVVVYQTEEPAGGANYDGPRGAQYDGPLAGVLNPGAFIATLGEGAPTNTQREPF